MKTPQTTTRLIRAAALACGLGLVCGAAAQDQPTLDELLDLAPAEPTPAPEPAADPEPAAEVQPTERVQERLSGKQIDDAMAQAVSDMGRVADRLDQDRDPGLDTQRLQEDILARLDQLIEAAEQQQQQSGGSSSSGSSSNQDSSAQNAPQAGAGAGQEGQADQAQASAGEHAGDYSPGQAGPVEPGQGPLEEVRSEWGELPPRLRDELTNGLDEPYSPVYRDLTEAYYRRLAEETSQ